MADTTEVATTEQPIKPGNVMTVVRGEIEKMGPQFEAALPAHIPLDRFKRVLLTAFQQNPKLIDCSKKSIWNAAMRAAQDGLLPDGREGAIVPYKDEAQWLPMVAGYRKKARNSGEIATWDVYAVFENDEFDFQLGDEPFIKHKPALTNKGKLIAVYSIATLKSGEKSRDVMSVDDVEKIRGKSRAEKGPWSDPVFYPEMAKKTVAKRHAKVLPSSTDLDDLLRRDDDLYNFKEDRDTAKDQPVVTAGASALDQFADEETHDPETGEIGAKRPTDRDDAGTSDISEEERRIENIKFEARDAAAKGRPKFPPSDMTDEADRKIYMDEWELATKAGKAAKK